MSMIKHAPWVGADFNPGPPRLLVLGEGHHSSYADDEGLTNPVIEMWLSGSQHLKFFTHIAVALTGQEPNEIDRRAVFKNIAFYNFVTTVMPNARVKPSWSDFLASYPAFHEVLDLLKPTHMIVFGIRLWDAMPSFPDGLPDGEPVNLYDDQFNIGRYTYDGGSTLAMRARHPAAGFNGREWFPRIQSFLTMD